MPALEGYTFEGYRNTDGSVGTRNLLAISTTVQCVAGVVKIAINPSRQQFQPDLTHKLGEAVWQQIQILRT